MAIIRKKLGNSRRIIDKRFREHFSDGLGGLRFDAFCCGWREAWKECEKQPQAENKKLKEEGLKGNIPLVILDQIKKFRTALEKLAKLGNEPFFGNSEGNRIAQQALKDK